MGTQTVELLTVKIERLRRFLCYIKRDCFFNITNAFHKTKILQLRPLTFVIPKSNYFFCILIR